MTTTFTQTEIQIVAKIFAAATPGTWVKLATVRHDLGDFDRATVDETFRKMNRLDDVDLIPESNQKTLTPADRAAAVHFGGQDKHLIWIEP